MFEPVSRPLLFIVSGPAGSGKTTLCERLLAEFPEHFTRVVTTTTRPPRPGETEAVDYYFFSSEHFQQLQSEGAFYETAEIHDRRYGTLKSEVQKRLDSAHHVLMNIDVQGAASYQSVAREDLWIAERLVTIFIQPESLQQIEDRLRKRGDSEAEIQRRLQTAQAELPKASSYDHVLKSRDKESDYQRLAEIIRKAQAG